MNPVANEVYNYSIVKSSSNEWRYQNADHKTVDTVKLNIGLQRLKDQVDTIVLKLTFNTLKLIPHPVKVIFINPKHEKVIFKIPTTDLDSICYYLQGSSLHVSTTANGNVIEVNGVDDVITKISKTAKLEFNNVKRRLSDYVSVEAVKDLLNRMLSIPRDKEAKFQIVGLKI